MKKIVTLFLALLCTCGLAQAAESLTADVTRAVHRAAVKKDVVTTGKFTYHKGGNMAITFSPTDKLMMEGTTYTIVSGKRKSVASGPTAELFGVMQRVVDDLLGGSDGVIAKSATTGGKVLYNGNTITIVPKDGVKANQLLFTSFVLTIDKQRHRLKSIKMNGKGKNYTLYTLSNYK